MKTVDVGDVFPTLTQCKTDYNFEAMPPPRFPKEIYGLADMCGNVTEYTPNLEANVGQHNACQRGVAVYKLSHIAQAKRRSVVSLKRVKLAKM